MAERELFSGGLHAVRAALARAPADALELWLRRDHGNPALGAVAEQAATLGIRVHHADAHTLDKLYGDSHHQGLVLRRRAPRTLALGVLLERLAQQPRPLVLVLDGVQDPRNFGACLRVADGAGADAVLYPRDKSAPLGSVVGKAASGAVDSVALCALPNLARGLAELAAAGVWITGTAHDADCELWAADLTPASALVLGNEGGGLRRLTRERCDALVRIPMYGALGSLNVATAAAVCLFEARRQRAAH